MRTIAFVNKKGGVGKTRSAVETAYILAVCYQQRVLLVDVDGQANATNTILGRCDHGGVAAMLGIQTFMIVAGVIKMIPLTGVTMPFISYGGSSIILMLAEIGMVLSVARRGRYEEAVRRK